VHFLFDPRYWELQKLILSKSVTRFNLSKEISWVAFGRPILVSSRCLFFFHPHCVFICFLEKYFLCCASLCLSPHFILPLYGSDEKIALLGAIQSLFEGSMYTFVFLWTPALSPNEEEIPHGFIFATFMLASMLGSSLASRLMARSSARVESYMQIVFAVSAASLLLPIVSNVCLFLFIPL
jgi:hypothetical protein